MEQNQLQKKLMGEIADRRLTPKPRWHFLLQDNTLKVFFVIVSLMGGVALATMHFILTDLDWDVFSYLDRSLLEHIIKSIPYLWIATFILLMAIAYLSFRKTRMGYRYTTFKLALGSLVISLVFGILLVGAGMDHILHNHLLKNLPLYEKLTQTKQDIWIFPERGLLSGKINGTQNDSFSLQDRSGRIWNIHTTEDTTIEPGVIIAPQTQVKIIGEMLTDNEFQAKVIRPWGR